jgi:hypothetical protein
MGDRPRPRRGAAVGLVIAIAGAGVIGYLIARPHVSPPELHPGPIPLTSPLSKSPVPIWPASTDGYSVADDLATHQIVVFGGLADNTATWLWDGSRWSLAQPELSPPGRIDAAAAYDPVLQVVLLFGGHGPPGTDLNDTWAWGGATWRELDKGTLQPPHSDASMAWDPELNEMVLMAGGPADTATSSWVWNNSRWTGLQSELPAPPPAISLGFDPETHELIAVSHGEISTSVAGSRTQTWAWDGTAWHRLTTHVVPQADVVVGLGWDPLSHRLLMFGGGVSAFGPGRMWAWNGTDWLQLPAVRGPLILDGELVSTDTSLLLVGALRALAAQPGRIDVWSWNDASWKPA